MLSSTACLTSARIRFSSALVSFVSAKAFGHMLPSSSLALSLKPNVAYRVLNFAPLWKKQTTLSSFVQAGMPYQVFGDERRHAGLDRGGEPLGHRRDPCSGISAIFAQHVALGDPWRPPAAPVRAPHRGLLLGR